MTRTFRAARGAALAILMSVSLLHGDACREGDLPCFRAVDFWFQHKIDVGAGNVFIHGPAELMSALDDAGLLDGDAEPPLPKESVDVLRQVAASAPPLEKRVREATQGQTCAVVGSAGNLVGAGYAAEIDAHDVVFRMNDAPVLGFEATVGRKTAFRVMNSVNTFSDGPDEILLQRSGLRAAAKQADFLQRNAARILLVDLRILEKIHMYFPKDTESTGVVALFVALNTCAEVDAYGFGPNGKGEYDYYYPRAAGFDAFHDKGEQERFLALLAEKKVAGIHAGKR